MNVKVKILWLVIWHQNPDNSILHPNISIHNISHLITASHHIIIHIIRYRSSLAINIFRYLIKFLISFSGFLHNSDVITTKAICKLFIEKINKPVENSELKCEECHPRIQPILDRRLSRKKQKHCWLWQTVPNKTHLQSTGLCFKWLIIN